MCLVECPLEPSVVMVSQHEQPVQQVQQGQQRLQGQGQPAQESDAHAASDGGILDGRVAAAFQRDIQPRERCAGPFQASL